MSFRENPEINTVEVIEKLGTGEALVSTLDEKGAPSIVQRTLIRPPSSRLGPATDAERKSIINESPVSGKYDEEVDRESAYELLKAREEKAAKEAAELEKQEEREKEKEFRNRKVKRRSNRQTPTEAATKTFMRTAARELTKYVMRGIFGSRRR
jgi:hypothetical protein